MRFRETQSSRGARLEGWAATWFETPRTRLQNLGRSKVAAPHHEAGRDRECIKLTGIRF
jgi:hypothetical protein